MGTVCPKCKTPAKIDAARYCINCGTRLPEVSPVNQYEFEFTEILELDTVPLYESTSQYDDDIMGLESHSSYQIDSYQNPSQPIRGAYAGRCPLCGHPMKWRRANRTGELYRGCDNFDNGCRYQERSY